MTAEQTDSLTPSLSPQSQHTAATMEDMADVSQADVTLISPSQVRRQLVWKGLKTNWQIFSENPIGLLGLAIVMLFGVMAISYPILSNTVWRGRGDPVSATPIYDPVIGFDSRFIPHPSAPSAEHLLGTDPLGRDILSQLLFSTSSEFALGLVAAVVTVVIATPIGAIAAYYGGATDSLLMRFADLIIMTPTLSLLIVLAALFRIGLIELALILGLLGGFGTTTVIIKSQALTIKVKPYIEAARVAGGGSMHIILVHLVPNLLPLSFLFMMFTVSGAILSEAILSFFGLIQVRMSWGLMVYETQTHGYLLQGLKTWWLLLPSSVAITLLSSGFYLVGRAMDEVVNPRLRRR